MQATDLGNADRVAADQVAQAAHVLSRLGLVTAFGHVSARTRAGFAISPAADLAVIDAGQVIEVPAEAVALPAGAPAEAWAHLAIYRARPDVGGVVHTHSTYASAWAARGEAIPCVLTAMADEFGGPIPLGPFALIGDEEIGRAVVETLAGHRSPAVLMQSHGVFTVGAGPRDALKAAVMCEDVARTVHISRQLGDPLPITADAVDRLYDRYQNVYGQR